MPSSGRSTPLRRDPEPTLWVHGLPARDLRQVIGYLSGDAHDRSKVQVLVDGNFYTLADMVEDDAHTKMPRDA